MGDNWLQILGLVIASLALVAAIVVPLIAVRLQRPKKTLGYTRPLFVKTLRAPHGYTSRISVMLDDAPIQDPHIFSLTVRNTGTEPIRADDFERAIRISFGDGGEIADAAADGNRPALRPRVTLSGPTVQLEPLLLNAGDEVRVSGLVASPAHPPEVTGRIVGVTDIDVVEPADTSRATSADAVFASAMLVLTALLVVSTLADPDRTVGVVDAYIPFAIATMLGVTSMMVMRTRLLRERRRRRTIDGGGAAD